MAILGAALAASILVAAPEYVRVELERRLTDLVSPTTVGRAELGWGVVRFSAVRLDGIGTIERLAIDAGPLELAVLGGAAVTEIRVSGCSLDLDAAHISRRLGGRETTPPVHADPPHVPAVVIERCSARLVDADGPLLAAAELDVDARGTGMLVTARDVEVGGALEGSAAEVVVGLERTGNGIALASLTLNRPRVRTGVALRTVFARLVGLFGAGAAPAADHPGSVSTSDTPAGDVLERFVSRTTPHAVLHVHDGTLESGSPSVAILEALTLAVSRHDDDEFRTAGSGRPSNGGAVEWDLTAFPARTSATGSLTATNVPLQALLPFLPELPLHDPHRALLSASLVLEDADSTFLDGHGSVTVTHLGLEHPRISSGPVRDIGITLRGHGQWIPGDRRLALDELRVELGSAAATMHGTIEWTPDHYLFDVHAELPPTDCHQAVHAIPADLLGDLTALELDGRIAGMLDVRVDSRDLDASVLRIEIQDRCAFARVPPSIDPGRFLGPFVHRVLEPDGDEFAMETGPGTEAWAALPSISPFLVHAVIAHEDASFFRHHGFAPWAIRDALVRDLREGRYVVGASTITMQLVKNVFLHREKTLARKIQEVLLTWWVERVMTKEQILALYLNVIEFGPATYGIRAGAEHWFGRPPSALSVAEAVYLACILPNPSLFAAEHRPAGTPPPAFRRRMRNLMRHLAESGRIDDAALTAGLSDIDTMVFHRPGDAAPAPRIPVGRAAALPISGWDEASVFGDETPDGLLDPELADEPAAESPGDSSADDDWGPASSADDREALDDTVRGWEDETP